MPAAGQRASDTQRGAFPGAPRVGLCGDGPRQCCQILERPDHRSCPRYPLPPPTPHCCQRRRHCLPPHHRLG